MVAIPHQTNQTGIRIYSAGQHTIKVLQFSVCWYCIYCIVELQNFKKFRPKTNVPSSVKKKTIHRAQTSPRCLCSCPRCCSPSRIIGVLDKVSQSLRRGPSEFCHGSSQLVVPLSRGPPNSSSFQIVERLLVEIARGLLGHEVVQQFWTTFVASGVQRSVP